MGDASIAGSSAARPTPPAPVSPTERPLGVAVAGIVIAGLALRPGLVSVGPLLPTIIGRFGLSHAQAALLVSIPDVLMGVLALPTPFLARRFGRDRVVLAALALLCATLLVRAEAPTTGVLLLATAGIGAGIAMAGALVPGFIKAAFPDRSALLIGIYATALSLGSTISAALTFPAVRAVGTWRFGLGIWAVPGVAAIAMWLLMARRLAPASPPSSAAERHPLPVDVPLAWMVGLFFACDNFLFYSDLSWIVAIYRDWGFDNATAGLILAAYTCTFIVSTPLAGALSRKRDRRAWLVVWSLFALLGAIGLAAMPDVLPGLWVAVIALGVGGAFTLGMTLPLDNARSSGEADSWNAFILMVGYVVAATGPIAVGALRDLTGTFRLPLWSLAGVAAAMLTLSPFLAPRSPR